MLQALQAQNFNCSGLIIFSDPEDYAPSGVPVYPNGPSLPPGGVQRGSLMRKEGDPLTPEVPSIGKLSLLQMEKEREGGGFEGG